MTTRNLVRTAPEAMAVAVSPSKKRGRPARPWLRPYVPVPHPHDRRQDVTVPPATVAAWCGVSRQTAARWATVGRITDAACERLCAQYAHGTVPIHGDAGLWAQFRFLERFGRNGMEWVLTTPGGDAMNAVQVWCAMVAYARYEQLLHDVRRLEARARAAEAEVSRLSELLACQC